MKPDLQPTLTGELVHLRPIKPDDFDSLFRAASDPLIWEQHPDNTRWQPDGFSKYFERAVESHALVVIDRNTSQIIGCSRFHSYNPERRTIIIGFTFLARSHWGGAYNGELKQLMMAHAFQFVDKIIFRVGEQNLRSRRAVEKIGGKFVGLEDKLEYGQHHAIYEVDRTS